MDAQESQFTAYGRQVATMAKGALRAASQGENGVETHRIFACAAGVCDMLLPGQDDDAFANGCAALRDGLKRLAQLGRAAKQRDVVLPVAEHQRRAEYHLLALHLHLAAYARHYDRLPQQVWSIGDDALPEAILPARQIEDFTDGPPPADRTHIALLHALCLLEYGVILQRDVDVEVVDAAVHAILSRSPGNTPGNVPGHISGDGSNRALHLWDQQQDSPDAWAYRELVGLHALSNLALVRRNRQWATRVQEIAMYHLEHTQPDFFTYEPWGLFGFLWSAKSRPFAEQQLHDVQTHLANATGPKCMAPGLLLADAAASLGVFG